MPVQPSVMRASGDTHAISVITSPAPPSARAPRWTRWKSFGVPSMALYMSIGDDDDAIDERHAAQRKGVNIGGGGAIVRGRAPRLGARPLRPANQPLDTVRDTSRSRSRRFSWLTRWLRVRSE